MCSIKTAAPTPTAACCLVVTNIINQNGRRVWSRTAGRTREISAHGQIQDHKKWLIENPLIACRNVRRRDGKKRTRRIISIELDLILRPDHSISVICRVVNSASIGESKAPADAASAGITWSMDGGRSRRSSILRDPFHDVLLAACWPPDCADVVAQHPECGPQAGPSGELHPRFNPAILEEIGRA